MNKTINLNKRTRNTIESILKLVESGEVKGIIVAGLSKDGTVISGWSDIDVCQQATLIGHLQVDMMDRFIKANYLSD
jgi:hypothetical protein